MLFTTADPKRLYRGIDAGFSGKTYTFKIAEEDIKADTVEEGAEFDRDSVNYTTTKVELEEYEDDDHRTTLALEVLREAATPHVSGNPVPTDYDYTTIFIDRERDETYLVDTSHFGYELERSHDDDGNVIEGSFVSVDSDAALRLR